MAGIGETVAAALARARALSEGSISGDLSPLSSFGSNPGSLRMWLHLPDGLPARAPLVVVLHGCGQTPTGYAAGAGWIELADRYGFALLCPEQTRANNANLCFNWFEGGDIQRGAGEAASIAQMVRHALADYDLDPRRVFATGLSAGGAMTAVLLATYPEVFAGGAVIGGLPYDAARGVNQALAAMRRMPDLPAAAWGDKVRAAAPAPGRWPRISIWHGGADATVSPAAGEALVRQWCDVHAVDRSATERTATTGHTHTTWRAADGEVVVERHTIAGLGHGAPIAADGVDGCGTPAPWILEAGVSSSTEIIRSWGLAGARRSKTKAAQPPRSEPSLSADSLRPASLGDVNGVIARALRGAGLLR